MPRWVNAISALPAPRPPLGDAPSRLAFIDNAPAIGIVLVVAGHAPGLPVFPIALIFSFHMPHFFLISGLVVGPDKLSLPTATRAYQLARTLLVPYAFFFIIAYAYWLVAKRHGLRAAEMESLPLLDRMVRCGTPSPPRSSCACSLWMRPLAEPLGTSLFTTAVLVAVLTLSYASF